MQDVRSKSHSDFICYEIEPGSNTVFGRCPLCRRIHHHGHPAGNRPNRVPHCGRSGLPEYRLVVQPGPAPAWLKAAVELPLGDLSLSIAALTTGLDGYWVDSHGNGHVIPDSAQIAEALRALRSCNFRPQADEIAAHLKAALAVNRRSSRSYWATEQGTATRLRIIATLRECTRTLGGLAPTERAAA